MRKSRLVYLAPILVVAAAAALVVAVQRRSPAPALEVHAEPAAATSADPALVEEVTSVLRPQLKKCMNLSLSGGGGEIVLEITIAPDGAVADVTFGARTSGITDDTASCLVALVRSHRFRATGRTNVVRMPVRIVVMPR